MTQSKNGGRTKQTLLLKYIYKYSWLFNISVTNKKIQLFWKHLMYDFLTNLVESFLHFNHAEVFLYQKKKMSDRLYQFYIWMKTWKHVRGLQLESVPNKTASPQIYSRETYLVCVWDSKEVSLSGKERIVIESQVVQGNRSCIEL